MLLGDVSITGSDAIADILIANCLFDNNSHIAIASNTAVPNLARICMIGSEFTGANQTTSIGATVLSAAVML